MTDTATTSPEIGGIGHSIKRVEDARLIEGQGNFLDDIALPGMLHMALVRSPIAHARINGIDVAEASAVEGVVAVVTGELMAAHNLAWMPTLSGDTQAVLATDKVRYQGQEVAAVIAVDPYVAADAAELVFVDYEPLTAVVTPQQALQDDAPVIRDEKDGQSDNEVYVWECGNADETEAAFAAADRVVSLSTHYPRSHPSPLETCGIVADVNSVTGQATLYMTSQAPHAHRTLFAMVAGLPEQNIRVISPDIGGGFGNKVPIYPGYVVATAASLLIGKPVKWVETRTGNLISTGFGRDYYMTGELALSSEGRIQALRVDMLSDQGRVLLRCPAHAVPRRAVPRGDRQLRLPPRARQVSRRFHEQGAGRRGISMLVPHNRGVLSHRAARPDSPRTRWASTRPRCGCGTSSNQISSPMRPPRASSTTQATIRRRCARPSTRWAMTSCAPSRPQRAPKGV